MLIDSGILYLACRFKPCFSGLWVNPYVLHRPVNFQIQGCKPQGLIDTQLFYVKKGGKYEQ